MRLIGSPEREVVDERFRSFVPNNAALELLIDGCRWLEGPVWFADHRLLIVSDIPNDRMLRITEAGEVSVFREPAGYPNGHFRDRQGRLVGCSHLRRSITRTELDGTVTTLVDHFDGKRLNSPNDVVVKRDGTIWFTDPPYGIETDFEGEKQVAELPPSVYCFDPASGRLACVADDFTGPNGLCFSPDERHLYVVDSGDQWAATPEHHIRVFEVEAEGATARLQGGRFFYRVDVGHSDGIRCDAEGNLWSAAGDGVHCIASSGDLLGKIMMPSTVSNLCFGGRMNSRLFMCAGHALYALTVNRRGCTWP